MELSENVEQNVRARQACNTLVELGITLAKDERLDPNAVRRMWQYVMETAAELIGDEVVEPAAVAPPEVRHKPHRATAAPLWEAPSPPSEDCCMPFGKHEGERLADVPDHYLKWLARQDWIDKWPEVLDYLQFHGFD